MTGTDENVRIFLFVLLPALSAHISSSVLVKYNSRCCREGQVAVSEFGEKAYFSIIFFVFFLLDFLSLLSSTCFFLSLGLSHSGRLCHICFCHHCFPPDHCYYCIFSYFAKTKFIYLGKRIFHVHASDYSSSSLHPQSVVCMYI